MLNENLRALRRARGLSQEELAARLPVARQTLSKWEQGRSVPDAHALARLAGELDTTVGALLGGQDPETQDLAARLEELNALLARRAESRRRRWRVCSCLAGILALLGGARLALTCWHLYQFESWMANTPGVIGGADRPTGIYLLGLSSTGLTLLFTLAAALAAGAGLWLTRKK